MAEKTYILKPKNKKSLVERVIYIKDGTVFSYTEGYTGGEWFFVGTEEQMKMILPPLDDDSVDMNMYFDWEFVGPADAELVEEAENIMEEDGHWALEEAGWCYEDTEWLVYNGLALTVEEK